MKSLERRFDNIAEKNPYWSSYICFAEAIIGQSFTKRTISYWFNRLVSKNDYLKKERIQIIRYLQGLARPQKLSPETRARLVKNLPRAEAFRKKSAKTTR